MGNFTTNWEKYQYYGVREKCNFHGRIEATDYELLSRAILSHWKSPEIDWEKAVLSKQFIQQSQTDAGFRYYY